MRSLTTFVSLTLTVLLGSAEGSLALPPCLANKPASTWSNCFGIWTISSGDWAGYKYVGEWGNDKYNGHGTFTFADGEKYVGEWRNNKRSGQGTNYYANGTVEEGIWENDNFLYAKKLTPDVPEQCPGSYNQYTWDNCFGTYTFANGGKNVGEWRNGKRHGQGTLTIVDGRVLEGTFENGEFKFAQKVTPTVTAKKSPPNFGSAKSIGLTVCPN